MGNDDDAPPLVRDDTGFFPLSLLLMAVLAVIVWDRRMAVFDGGRAT